MKLGKTCAFEGDENFSKNSIEIAYDNNETS